MHPEAFQKLWACSRGQVPHLQRQQFQTLSSTMQVLTRNSDVQYWGLVADSMRYRGHMLLHCYNFGNAELRCPWTTNIVNFGEALPARIINCGTVRHREPFNNVMLDKLQQPYLVFGYEMEATASEFLQSGMLVSVGALPEQRRCFDVVFPDDAEPPVHPGVLWYFLMKRIPFTVEPAERWVAPGAPAGYPRVRITLDQPVVMEQGWPVLLLEKHRWLWGVVSAA